MIEELSFVDFCAKVGIADFKSILKNQISQYDPQGWFICVCDVMDSSKLGRQWTLPYGPRNTHKVVPEKPFSIDGTASGTVCARYKISREKVESNV